MSSYSSAPSTYDAQPPHAPQHQHSYQQQPQLPQPTDASNSQALIPRPPNHHSTSSYTATTPTHLTPYDPHTTHLVPVAAGVQNPNYAYAPQPSRRHSSQSHHSRHSTRSHRSHRGERSSMEEERREERQREIEKRPSLGDTVMVVWGAVLGAFGSRRRV